MQITIISNEINKEDYNYWLYNREHKFFIIKLKGKPGIIFRSWILKVFTPYTIYISIPFGYQVQYRLKWDLTLIIGKKSKETVIHKIEIS